MANAFEKQKKAVLSQADLSKKGSVDEPILDLIGYINSSENYFSTSSCSGRICVFSAAEEGTESKKKHGRWLFVSHKAASECAVVESLQDCKGSAVLKFEPFVLHVQCRILEDAQNMLRAALTSGFRNSGIVLGKKGRIMMAVRGTQSLEVPLVNKGEVLVSEKYIRYLVKLANEKMEENLQRIDRFSTDLKQTLNTKSEKYKDKVQGLNSPPRESQKRGSGGAGDWSTHLSAGDEGDEQDSDSEQGIIECLASFYDET